MNQDTKTPKKTDRRIIKAKKLFRESLISLMREIPYEKITVTDICERADVNRNTFYYHYENIDALLNEIIHSVLEDIRTSAGAYDDDITVAIIKQCRAYQKHADILNLLLLENFNVTFARQLLDMDCTHSEPIIREINKQVDPEQAEIISAYVSVGGIAVISTWLKQGMKKTPEEIGRLLYSLAMNGARQTVEKTR